MYRTDLPRIYELRDLFPDPLPPDACFGGLDGSYSVSPQKLRQYRDLEQDLAGLDTAAWEFLKSEVQPLLQIKHETRGWQPVFDKLNQAKAYNYLKCDGYHSIRFIPPILGRKTPDLEAHKDSARALCEVKTINVSKIEAGRRLSGGVSSTRDQLENGFFRKLSSDLARAESQIAAYASGTTVIKLAFVIINFDDLLHEYEDRYREQIEQHIARHPTPGLEVSFYWKPRFGSAAI
jgi:hypothetical protein